jgi:phosphoglycolate phosphatase
MFKVMPQNFLTPVQVIIFDCDGVLFDSRKANQFFYNHLLNHFGKPDLAEEDLNYVHMHTVNESVNYLFERDSDRLRVNQYRQTLDYTPFIQKMEIEPGLIPFLEYIRTWAKTAVSTNRTNTIGAVLDTFGLTPYFDMVVSALDVRRPKPDPESVYRIMDRFKINRKRCLFIGDSEVDAQTASNAGVPLVAYKNPELPAFLHVQDYEELAGHLKRGRLQ